MRSGAGEVGLALGSCLLRASWQVQGFPPSGASGAAPRKVPLLAKAWKARGHLLRHLCGGTSSLYYFSAPLWGLLRPPSMANNVTLSDRFNINSQLEHLQASASTRALKVAC